MGSACLEARLLSFARRRSPSAFIRSDAAVMGPRFKFAKHGKCGAELAEVLPGLAGVVDEIAAVETGNNGMYGDVPEEEIVINSVKVVEQ